MLLCWWYIQNIFMMNSVQYPAYCSDRCSTSQKYFTKVYDVFQKQIEQILYSDALKISIMWLE
jgi:hypothetical protein